MSLVKYSVEDRIAYITLARPEKRNALNPEMVNELKVAFKKAADDKTAKVVILRAEGEVFSAGADLQYLSQLQEFSHEENLADSTNLMELFQAIYQHDKIVIAQVEGHAIAGGCGLATVCDFVFAVPEAKFGYTETKIGFIPAIVMVFLIRKVGEGKAKELLFTGDLIEAEEAKQIGLVNYIDLGAEMPSLVKQFANTLVRKNSADSLRLTKKMIATVQDMPHEAALEYAAEMNAQARKTEDCKKGIAAFLNKEKISW